MASVRGIEKLRYVVLDKANASRGTAVGNVLLCYQNRKQASTDSVTTIGDFELWDTVDHVKARVEELKTADAAGGGAIGVPSPTGKEGFIKSIDNVKRSDLHHFTTNWNESVLVVLDCERPQASQQGAAAWLHGTQGLAQLLEETQRLDRLWLSDRRDLRAAGDSMGH